MMVATERPHLHMPSTMTLVIQPATKMGIIQGFGRRTIPWGGVRKAFRRATVPRYRGWRKVGAMSHERVVDVALRWGDSDAFAHVNNVVFFRLLEEARARVIPQDGPGSTILKNGLVVAEQQLKYTAPLHYRAEPVQVGMTVDHIGGSSFRLAARVFDAGSGVVFAKGFVSLVAYDFDRGAPRKLTDDERQWLNA
jgi:acyl-CoA thioester hydrolase